MKILFVLSLAAGALLVAQPPPGMRGGPGMGPRFLEAEFGVPGKVVTGTPFTAQAVSETSRTLSDGNQIATKSTATLARDSQGRTRREETLTGPWASNGQTKTAVFIHDPVSQTAYTLQADTKVARKMSLPTGARSARGTQFQGGPAAHTGRNGAQVTTESLGTQTIAGVVAEGTRITRTIPAGQVGNAKPLVSVTERWYSSDLQMVVMSKHTDPMMGETTYTLTNIQRAEPDASLFTVPAGYTVSEAKPGMHTRN